MVTEDRFSIMTERSNSAPNEMNVAVNDVVFVMASAWKSSFYRQEWPYAFEMSTALFEARVEKVLKNNKVQLSFSAFEMEDNMREFSRYLNYFHWTSNLTFFADLGWISMP